MIHPECDTGILFLVQAITTDYSNGSITGKKGYT
jgi:hypothetical protein